MNDDDDDDDDDDLCAAYKQWNDFQLEWQPEKFGNITKTRLPVSKLWIPDVSVLNRLVSCRITNILTPNLGLLAK